MASDVWDLHSAYLYEYMLKVIIWRYGREVECTGPETRRRAAVHPFESDYRRQLGQPSYIRRR